MEKFAGSGRKGLCRRGLRAVLVLEDGLVFEGCGFGSEGLRVGEVVFTTSMVGYPESITDPSYMGQILVITHPLVGNYGVARKDLHVEGHPDLVEHFESPRPVIEGLAVFEETEPSHWSSEDSLHGWLRRSGVPGISRIDTRALVKRLRESGVMMGLISVWGDGEGREYGELLEILRRSPRYDEIPYAYRASPGHVIEHPGRGPSAAVLDCGVKLGILRELVKRGFRVLRYPCTSLPERIVEEADGVIVSNGPGNPRILEDLVERVRNVLEYDKPVLGICLGHQIISMALGGDVYKLRYGHRGANKPVIDLTSGKGYISTHNHGYAVSRESLEQAGLRLWFVNADDNTVEGVRHERKPIMGVQFHPEAGPGPYDLTWIFDLFKKTVEKFAARRS